MVRNNQVNHFKEGDGDNYNTMSYILISTQVRLERGPTIVGDSSSDPLLMFKLNATQQMLMGNDFMEWRTNDPPRIVLNTLHREGYKVIAMTGIGQTCAWTLCKEGDRDGRRSMEQEEEEEEVVTGEVEY